VRQRDRGVRNHHEVVRANHNGHIYAIVL
jgi:hypothetical protein